MYFILNTLKCNSFLGGIYLQMKCFEKTCTHPTISSEILYLANTTPQANVKIVHNEQLDPLAYAIGFGCKSNSSLIIGGINENDWLSTRMLIMFARTLCNALSKNIPISGINISEIFRNKGVWIIPKFANVTSPATAMNFIVDKIDPRQIIELTPGDEYIRYYPAWHNQTNVRLFAYIMASSTGYPIQNFNDYANEENSLCSWFAEHTQRPAYSMLIDKDTKSSLDDLELLFDRLLESLVIFASS